MSDLSPPKATRGDQALSLAKRALKGAVGAVPGAGGALAEAVDLLFRLPLESRRERWVEEVARAVEEIRERHPEVDLQSLQADPEFITTLHRATDIAVRTHQEEKIAALRQAVVNAALPSAPTMDLRSFFLQLVEELSPTHLRILAVYNDPPRWFREHNAPAPTNVYAAPRGIVLAAALPDLMKDDTWRVFVAQLEARGLMGGISGIVDGGALLASMTTPLGQQFLRFISNPDSSA